MEVATKYGYAALSHLHGSMSNKCVVCALNNVDVSLNSLFVYDGTTIVGSEAITFVLFIIGLCALTQNRV